MRGAFLQRRHKIRPLNPLQNLELTYFSDNFL